MRKKNPVSKVPGVFRGRDGTNGPPIVPLLEGRYKVAGRYAVSLVPQSKGGSVVVIMKDVGGNRQSVSAETLFANSLTPEQLRDPNAIHRHLEEVYCNGKSAGLGCGMTVTERLVEAAAV